MNVIRITLDLATIKDMGRAARMDVGGTSIEVALVNAPEDRTEEVISLREANYEVRNINEYLQQQLAYQKNEVERLKLLLVKNVDREQLEAAARPFLAKNEFINAIKEVRSISGLGLKESKDFVDGLRAKMAEEAAHPATAALNEANKSEVQV